MFDTFRSGGGWRRGLFRFARRSIYINAREHTYIPLKHFIQVWYVQGEFFSAGQAGNSE